MVREPILTIVSEFEIQDWQMSESNMAEFKMAAIIKLSQNEWVKFFYVQNGWYQYSRIQDGCNHQVEWEWIGEVFFVQNGWIQDGRMQDGWHHQSVFEIELVWVRVRVEWECFWVNLREVNKVSESKMAVSESNMAEFKMAAITKFSQNEWVKFFCANGGNQCWLNPWWQNSRWLPSSHWVRMNEWSFFVGNWWVSLKGKTKMAESKMA